MLIGASGKHTGMDIHTGLPDDLKCCKVRDPVAGNEHGFPHLNKGQKYLICLDNRGCSVCDTGDINLKI